jgi:hypothetical protein
MTSLDKWLPYRLWGALFVTYIDTGNIGPRSCVTLPTSLESFCPDAEVISGQGLITGVPPLLLFQVSFQNNGVRS